VPNLAAALKKEPRIAKKLRFVGMFGSVAKGYGGKAPADPEWNVKGNVPPCQKVFKAAWPMTITPLDTCGLVRLTGPLYQKVPKCQDPLMRALMDSYRIWAKVVPWEKGLKPDVTSSTLFDTVAVYLAFSEKWIHMKEMGIRVTDDGFTKVDEKAKRVRVALDWKDLEAFKTFLVERLTGNPL
jgi:inosine-uridine nucleoside N-ribohydrolase